MSLIHSHWDCRRSRQRGMVLVIVLWIVTLLAVMAGSFAYSMRTETRLATSAVERSQARALAEAGIAYALAWQLDLESGSKLWPPNGDPHEWFFGGRRLRIQVTDANGLVNLNTADADLLNALFTGVGMDSADAEHLIAAILDWRESDQQRQFGVASRPELRSTGQFRSKKARFESIEELQQIEGVTKDIYERIANGVTAFSHHAGISPELAPAWLLQTLGLDEQAVADYVTARARAAADGAAPPPLPSNGKQFFSSGGHTNVYHIAVAVETETGTTINVKVVADVQGGFPSRSPRLLAWREGY